MTSKLKFSITSAAPETQRGACIVVGVFEKSGLTPAARVLDRASKGALRRLLRNGDIEGRVGETAVLQQPPGIAAERVMLAGCGKDKKLSERNFQKIVSASVETLTRIGVHDACVGLTELDVPKRDLYWKARQCAEIVRHTLYRSDALKSTKSTREPALSRIVLPAPSAELTAGRLAIKHATAIANGIDLARELGDLPPNICTPTYLATRARALARSHGSVKTRVLSEAEMAKLGMETLLSVARGSREPAKLIVLEYAGGRKNEAPVVLVGKGVTFDSGGISIKPAGAMDEMKYDMCGAASVLGAVTAAAEMGLEVNLVGIIPATENLPGGNATRPGDIVTSMSKQTVEILNTDAEGRLILCDALTYAARFKPEVVVDIATLTGACVIALGSHASGLLSNDSPLAQALLEAGEFSGDRAWELPLWDNYQDQLKSNFADMANVGGREAGTITAACFLSRYTTGYRWAHLDIAGTAWRTGARKGATGRPVRLLTQFLMDRSSTPKRRR